MTIWRKVHIKGYSKYYVSNYGDVVNIKSGLLLTPTKLYNGGLRVTPSNKVNSIHIMVHILVYKHFKKNELGTNLIWHKDGERENNHSPNLEAKSRGDYLRLCYENKKRVRGVYVHEHTVWSKKQLKPIVYKRYRATIKVNHKVITMGYYNTKKEATECYIKAYQSIYGRLPY